MERNRKAKIIVMSLTLALTLANCSTPLNNTANLKTNDNITEVITNNKIDEIRGTTHFPEPKRFTAKAVIGDVRASATVSLLYPSDYSDASLRNVTIATGLTNANSAFSISLGSFTPSAGKVYVLEAVKRLGGTGNYVVTLRTHVKWTGSSWLSMTTPGIDLNIVTTGLAIISSLNPQDLASADTIAKVPVSGGVAQVNDINGVVTKAVVQGVLDLENQVLTEDQDPFAAIYFSQGQYLFHHTVRGADSLTNTFTALDQRQPAIGMDNQGDYVIAWQSGNQYNVGGQDGSNYGIYAQRYNYSGRQVGSEFMVNTFTTGNQKNPSLAMDSKGDFVIAWQSNSQDGSNYGVYAQRYDSSGTKLGSEFQVNTLTTGNQENPSVAMDSRGDFVIAWEGGPNENTYDIWGRRYNSSGVAQGSDFIVNTLTTNRQENPSVAMDTNGDFVIAWDSYIDNIVRNDVRARIFNSSGVARSSEFQVNTFTTDMQFLPSVAMDSRGDFVIAWNDYGYHGGSGYDISAQRYNNSGTKVGLEFMVNSNDTRDHIAPSVGMDLNGDFVISWESNGVNIKSLNGKQVNTFNAKAVNQLQGGSYDIFARRYNSAGVAQGSEFQVNTFTTNNQELPAIAMDNAGDFVIAWDSNGEANKYDIYHKRYNNFAVPQFQSLPE